MNKEISKLPLSSEDISKLAVNGLMKVYFSKNNADIQKDALLKPTELVKLFILKTEITYYRDKKAKGVRTASLSVCECACPISEGECGTENKDCSCQGGRREGRPNP